MPTSDRLRDVDGEFPLAVMLWLDTHPTSVLAVALGLSAPSVRWVYPFGETLEVVVRGARVETYHQGARDRVGSARIHGMSSAADFDLLPEAPADAPFRWPVCEYPSRSGFATDSAGNVARFSSKRRGVVPPGLPPKLAGYDNAQWSEQVCMERLAVGHSDRSMAYPPRAFVANIRDLVASLKAPDVVGPARVYARFLGDRVLLLPEETTDFAPTLLAQLHARKTCLGCSRHDPRDVLSLATWNYAQPSSGTDEAFVQLSRPHVALPLTELAEAMGRSTAELAATQMDLSYEDSARISSPKVRLPS
ncbi:MAG: hypothetical protein Q8Q09_14895 [Deltaproteobacteria bacterium]|nr:hypothetical protein [Deltaproteobacteria bacterium]